MKGSINTILTFLFLLQARSIDALSPPTVDLGYHRYIGYTNDTAKINYFYGIPYAQPPVGTLRWKAPRPIEGWDNLKGHTTNASIPAPICYQSVPPSLLKISVIPPGIQQSEDCLILNVKAPLYPVNRSLPVIAMIHGGGYTLGSPEIISPCDAIVHAANGSIVCVEIQYRLGFFGFLAGSEVSEDGTLNVGLLDQRAALAWIQRNIDAFGGDPSRVTIWGGSAGGGSVTHQLIAGGATDKPPFSAAIAEYPWWTPLLTLDIQERQYRDALSLANCSDLTCLRNQPTETLQNINQAILDDSYPGPGYGYGLFYWGPVVDGKFIRQLPNDEFKHGNFYDVPILLDHSAYEGLMFSNTSISTSMEESADAMSLFPSAGRSFLSRLYQLYPRSAYNSTFYQRQTWFGDFIINCPTYYVASAFADHSNNSSAVFKLTFAAGNQLHGATGPFLTSVDIGFPGADNVTIAELLSSYWISFAIAHDPNPLRDPRAPFWPSYSSKASTAADDGEVIGFNVLHIGTHSIAVEEDPDVSAQCDFFSGQGHVVWN